MGLLKGIGLIPNWQKERASEVIGKISTFFEGHGVPVYIVPEKEPLLKLSPPIEEFREWPQKVELVIVVGGDGTFLRAAREIAMYGLPILGINLGYKGFLSEIELTGLEHSLEKVVKKEYFLGERMMLRADVYRDGELFASSVSLNDVIISRGPFSRIIRLDTYINEDFLESYPGDGIIVATPTGSTGYSLSAGGPVLNPSLKTLIITPICPHLLYQRSVIVGEEEVVTVIVNSEYAGVFITLDGQEGFALQYKDRVEVRKADCSTRVVTFPTSNFYKLLHEKLMRA